MATGQPFPEVRSELDLADFGFVGFIGRHLFRGQNSGFEFNQGGVASRHQVRICHVSSIFDGLATESSMNSTETTCSGGVCGDLPVRKFMKFKPAKAKAGNGASWNRRIVVFCKGAPHMRPSYGAFPKAAVRLLIVFLCLVALFACDEPSTHQGHGGPASEMAPEVARPQGETGAPLSRLDLSSLEIGETVILHPVWDFYWGKLLLPDELSEHSPDLRTAGMDIWSKIGFESSGYATYRTLIPIPPGRPMGFQFSQQLTSVKVFLDGKLVASDGIPGRSPEDTKPARSNLIVEHASESGLVELVLHIANFHSFRGGARGVVEIGPAQSLRQSRSFKRSLELLASGFLLSIALYHLILFAMQRGQWMYLLFALTCLSFALRIPFLGEKTIHDLWPGLAWEIQYRFNMGLNIVTPPLLILFFHLLFPAALNRKLLSAFLVVCSVFAFSIFLNTIDLGRIMFAYYLVAAGPALLMGFYMALVYGLRHKGSGRTMAVGMGVVSILGVMAIYQNWYTRDYAGQLAILAFVSFGFFQAIGVAQRHKESVVKEKALAIRLQRSREALSHQRQSLENDLHDSLGSKLVDLKLQMAEARELNRQEVKSRIDDLYSLFRGQLLFMEDLDYSAKDPITGIQLSLLRRYSGAGRELRFSIREAQRPFIERYLLEDSFRMEFLQLCREICTNDLKYGEGESRWSLSVNREESLTLRQINSISARSSFYSRELESADPRPSIVPVHARRRAQKLSGVFQARVLRTVFACSARFPSG